MPLETPKFWQSNGIIPALLSPLSWVYGCGHRIKTAMTKTHKADIPVICVGGVVAGGSGKTPVVHAIIRLIREHNLYNAPFILTRGYGGEYNAPLLVDADYNTFQDVGDESLLHAMCAPTVMSKDRPAGVSEAQKYHADVIVLDDGLQNPSLHKDIAFLVIDAKQGIGNGYILPAGPLRESIDDALQKVRAIIYTNGRGADYSKPVFTTSLHITSDHDKTQEYFAFAGLGHPEKFKDTLVENGFNVTGFQSFADHHPYSASDIDILLQRAGTRRLITTEKDYMRLTPEQRMHVDALRIELTFDQPDEFLKMLKLP